MAVTETVKIVFEVDNKPISDTVTDLQQLGKVTEQDAAKFKQLGEASKQAAKDVTTLDKSIEDVVDTSKDVGKSSEGFVSLRTQLKQAKEDVQKLSDKFGEFSPQANAARARAGELADKMSDLNRQVGLLNPESKIKAFTALGSGIVGTFQIATGALQAFGSENKEVEKIAQKLQGALNVVQGIQSLKQLKESYEDVKVVLGFTTVAQTTLTTATETGAAATGAATAANRGFAASLSATGIGAIVVALGLLAGAMLMASDETDDNTEETDKNTAARKKNEDAIKKQTDELRAEIAFKQKEFQLTVQGTINLQRQVDILKARGASAKEIFDAEQKLRNEELRQLEKIKQAYIAKGVTDEAILDIQTQIAQKRNDIAVAEVDFSKKQREKSVQDFKKAEDDKLKALQDAQAKRDAEEASRNGLRSQFEQELNSQLSEIDKKTNLEKLRNANQYFNDEKGLALANLASEISNLDERLLKLKEFGKEGTDEYQAALAQRALYLKEFGKIEVDITKKTEEEKAEIRKKQIDQAFEIANSTFELAMIGIQNQTDAEIESLEKRKEAGIISEQEYQRQLKKIRQKAAEDEKKAQIFQATMSAAQAILSALAITGDPATKAAAVAFAAITSALNLAKIVATPIPKFNKGTLSVPGIDTGGDSVMAMLRPGEAVIPTDTNRSYAPSIKAIYQKQIKPSEINAFVLNKLSGRGSIGRDTAITASVDTFALSKAMNKNRAVEVTNANIVGKVIANEMMKAYNPRR